MHKNMQKLYESLGSYYAFDPHVLCVEDFFGDLASFRTLFVVSTANIEYTRLSQTFLACDPILISKHFCNPNVYKK